MQEAPSFTRLGKIDSKAAKKSMSVPLIPESASLVMSVLVSDIAVWPEVKKELEGGFGPIEEDVGPLGFDFTSYYEREMGKGIVRRLWRFECLVGRVFLADVKQFTNRLEQEFARSGKRVFNLDPGLLSLENFILATGKNRAHRVYLQKGIFADLTLTFEKGSFRPTPWTYPDYRDAKMIQILNSFRESHLGKLRK
jgi:hypothetical protein